MADVAKMKDIGLLVHLRRWGLKVEPVAGWRERGRPYNFYPRAITVHHDASGRNSGNAGALGLVTHGRPGLSGPLSQFVLARDGTVFVVAAGYSNHAGYGGPRAGVPENMGNTYSVGIEAANDGVGEPWSRAQLNAYYRLCAALLVWIGKPNAKYVFGHKEWTTRKIDPAGINMANFRRQVTNALQSGPSVQTVRLASVQPGKRNADVLKVKHALKRRGHGDLDVSGKTANYFGKGLRNEYAEWQRKLGYTGKDADGIPGASSLRKLGFRVIT